MVQPRIIIAIPSYKRPEAVRTLLGQLDIQQGDEAFDVYVLNDGGGGGVEQLLQSFETNRFRLYWQSTDEPSGLPSARNRILDMIHADWNREPVPVLVVFLDDDCEVNTNFVQEVSLCAQSCDAFTFRIKTVGLSGIVNTLDNAVVRWLLKPFIGRAWLRIGFLRGGYFQELSKPRQVHHMPGGCLIYRFDKNPRLRFDEKFNEGNAIHEDVDFSQALRRTGTEIWYCGWHEVVHRPPSTGGVRIDIPKRKFYYYWKHKWFLVKKWRGARYLPAAFLTGFFEAWAVSLMHRRWLFGALFNSYRDASRLDPKIGKRTRVCSPQSGINPQSTLGGEVYDANILREIVKDVDIEILLPADRPCSDAGVGWSITTMPRAQSSFGYYYRILKLLRRVYRARPFDILRVHSPYIMAAPVLLFKLLYPKVQLYAQYHHVEERWFFRVITRLAASRWDGISAASDTTRQELCNVYGAQYYKVNVSHPGVETDCEGVDGADKVREFRDANGLQNQFVLLHVGSLIARKNARFLISMIAASLPSVILVVIGDGPEREVLEKYAKDSGCSARVRFLGKVKDDEKLKWMRAADVLALASRKEGFGISVIEAAKLGTPAIVSDCGSLPEIVHDGITGAVLPLSVDEWRRVVESWMDNPELVQRLGTQAREHVEGRFSWEEAGRKQAEHIRSILEQNVKFQSSNVKSMSNVNK